jgi:predicted enzyme related to lactoylglutathione lyase
MRSREGQTAGTLNTIAIPSLDATLNKIEQQGRSICVPKMANLGVGWPAYAENPAGNVFGIMESDTNTK